MQWPLQQLITDPRSPSQQQSAHELEQLVTPMQGSAVRTTQAGLVVLGTSEPALDLVVSELIKSRPHLKVGKPQINYVPGDVWSEPICRIKVKCPAQWGLHVAGDLESRRAVVVSTKTIGTQCLVEAEIAMAELFGYETTLRSLTQGAGSYEEEYIGYQFVRPSGGPSVA